MIKPLSILLFIIFSSSVWAGLAESVELKTKNYAVLEDHYQTLLRFSEADDKKSLCEAVRGIYPSLERIFYDDQQFALDLRETGNSDFIEYAAEIENNSFSPLFAYNIYKELCEDESRPTVTSLGEGLRRHLINVDYLSMIHNYWREAYGPF